MDSDASFHATYYKEELERFKLGSGKVRLVDDKTLDIAGVRDVVLKSSFGTIWTLKDVRIGMKMLASKGNAPAIRKVYIYFCKLGGLGKQKKLSFIMSKKTRKLQRLEQVHIEGYGPTFIASIAESMGLRAAAPKMLWADLVGTAYLIYLILYVLIGLRISEEEWRGKDTSLAHLKNDSIVAEHGLSSEITQSLGGSSDTSEGSENSGNFKDSGRSNEEYSEDATSSKEGGFETL
ncbi:hypothetical protein Tco_1325031 [Tanacetum coccineum]